MSVRNMSRVSEPMPDVAAPPAATFWPWLVGLAGGRSGRAGSPRRQIRHHRLRARECRSHPISAEELRLEEQCSTCQLRIAFQANP